MSTAPQRPGDDIDDDERRIIDERLKTFEEDVKAAEPWDVVRERILKKLKHAAPR